MDDFLENFRSGGGSKKFRCNFFALETALLFMNFRKNFEIGGGAIYDPKNFVANSVLVVMTLEKIATFFPKKGWGGGLGGMAQVRPYDRCSPCPAVRPNHEYHTQGQ